MSGLLCAHGGETALHWTWSFGCPRLSSWDHLHLRLNLALTVEFEMGLELGSGKEGRARHGAFGWRARHLANAVQGAVSDFRRMTGLVLVQSYLKRTCA